MGRLPQPPASAVIKSSLRADQDIVTVSRKTRLVRIFTARGAHVQRWNTFRYVGPLPHGEFDPHPITPDSQVGTFPEHGVLYFSLSLQTSIAETFQVTSIVDRRGRSPHVAVFRPRRAVRLLDLTGLWPTRVGASQDIWVGANKPLSQAWARTIREALPDIDGLWFRSSMDAGEPALCLWDPPGASCIPSAPDLLLPLAHPSLDEPLARICEQLNYILI
ncbi:RES family NAD+ phosphorylase [Amycolatopsis sp. NPDC004772]